MRVVALQCLVKVGGGGEGGLEEELLGGRGKGGRGLWWRRGCCGDGLSLQQEIVVSGLLIRVNATIIIFVFVLYCIIYSLWRHTITTIATFTTSYLPP